MDNLTTSQVTRSLGSGLGGAIALTILHETVRQFVPTAPRADILGMRGIAKGFRKVGEQPPGEDDLYSLAMVGDVASNALYYSLIGFGRKVPVLTGAALGALAGVGAVTLPGPMGLGEKPTTRTSATVAMTVGWYLFGGLVAGVILKQWQKGQE
ncbi:hypothetical protein ACFSUS_20135 [Spirosoma soli]|uniref:DUF1440 domain-containing protein n=1 Tax=Spirosoma soli TaxID=1770529 RepID=A0ABW5M7M6_9BACT